MAPYASWQGIIEGQARHDRTAGSRRPQPILITRLLFQRFRRKNAASTLSRSKSRTSGRYPVPRARQAKIRYAACRELSLRKAGLFRQLWAGGEPAAGIAGETASADDRGRLARSWPRWRFTGARRVFEGCPLESVGRSFSLPACGTKKIRAGSSWRRSDPFSSEIVYFAQ